MVEEDLAFPGKPLSDDPGSDGTADFDDASERSDSDLEVDSPFTPTPTQGQLVASPTFAVETAASPVGSLSLSAQNSITLSADESDQDRMSTIVECSDTPRSTPWTTPIKGRSRTTSPSRGAQRSSVENGDPKPSPPSPSAFPPRKESLVQPLGVLQLRPITDSPSQPSPVPSFKTARTHLGTPPGSSKFASPDFASRLRPSTPKRSPYAQHSSDGPASPTGLSPANESPKWLSREPNIAALRSFISMADTLPLTGSDRPAGHGTANLTSPSRTTLTPSQPGWLAAESFAKVPSDPPDILSPEIPPISSTASHTSTAADSSKPFLLRPVGRPPRNPRAHDLLEYIYAEMHAASFINLNPLSLLPSLMSTYFKGECLTNLRMTMLRLSVVVHSCRRAHSTSTSTNVSA